MPPNRPHTLDAGKRARQHRLAERVEPEWGVVLAQTEWVRLHMARQQNWSPDAEYLAKRDHLLGCLQRTAQFPGQFTFLFLDEMSYCRWPQASRNWMGDTPQAADSGISNNSQWRMTGKAIEKDCTRQQGGHGQRLSLTAYQAGSSLSTSYLLDGNRLLAATANSQTTYYLNGIAELAADRHYYLTDGTNSVRQLSEAQGAVTLTRSFTPWGELLEQSGNGDFTWGYLGELVDADTGLIYVGNGQYYDPATGRFLFRCINPGSPPYVPWHC